MKPRNGTLLALFFLATCSEDTNKVKSGGVESARLALGDIPASEVATWQRIGGSSLPGARYLQAAAFDETRKVVVMFGGQLMAENYGSPAPTQETWEWSTATGKWTNRTGTGTAPAARSGAAMVYDSQRNKVVLFGGRAASGYNYEDTWEWDPTSATWTDLTNAGRHPTARSQHAMVYEKSTGKILLFGGGRSSSYGDPAGISISVGDTWELDPATHTWTALQVTASPTARHDLGMAWDSTRNKAVVFGGMQLDIAGAQGIPKQDTWEWDPTTAAWTERTAQGAKPSARYGHTMAYDLARKNVVLVGGVDIGTGGGIGDVWDWDPASGAWTQRLTGSEAGALAPRMYASLVADSARSRMELVAGQSASGGGPYGTGGMYYPPGPMPVPYGSSTSSEVWELDPAAATFTDRSAPSDIPRPRIDHATAYNPSTGLVYVFGGSDLNGQYFDDLWSWDGKLWTQVATTTKPSARGNAGLAYDPARNSLILFGGSSNSYSQNILGDTWEWSPAKGWVQLQPSTSPDPLIGPGMVTDTAGKRILLFGGQASYGMPYPYGPDAGPSYGAPFRNEVWQWDGGAQTWTNLTASSSTSQVPTGRASPVLAFDEGRNKLFVYDTNSIYSGYPSSQGNFWEWDPLTAGWSQRVTYDALDWVNQAYVAYDSTRRRMVLLTDAKGPMSGAGQTWELTTKEPTWYVRSMSTVPSARNNAAMAFDSGRGVVVLFGGIPYMTQGSPNETWEYKVTALGNGEGCTASFASRCASGNCVDGVCCESASCTGPCKSCNVAGSEGTCVLAAPGTEVPGSCAGGQACDSTGSCKSRNGQACSSASGCASGNCVDGVCCDQACDGSCVSCNLSGRAGKCTPYQAGSDPQGECGGSGTCAGACDGVGTCTYPGYGTRCGTCQMCNGNGSCSITDYYCPSGGGGSIPFGTGGYPYRTGGTTGSGGYRTGGAGGAGGTRTGGAGGTGGMGGSGGVRTGGAGGSMGGAGGSSSGSGGSAYNNGGTTGTLPNLGGTIGSAGGAAGTSYDGGGIDGGRIDGGRIDAGRIDGGGIDAITMAQLHRSGCSCDIGSANAGSGLWAAFFLLGSALFVRRAHKRRK